MARTACAAVLLLLPMCVLGGEARKMEIGTNFWDVGWGGSANDPFVEGFKSVRGENPWKPQFLEEIRVYTVFRFMDWGKANNAAEAHPGTRWADRVQKGNPVQRPMAYEWMIDLCNRTKRDLWVCLPHFADETYMFELGRLIRDQLDPALKCYVEWSNETWNGMFKQAHYCVEQGAKLKLPEGAKWSNNAWYRGQMYHAMRTFETFHQFERAFQGQRGRLVTVIGGTTVHAFAQTHIEAIASPLLNPHGVKPDAYSIAPYFGNGLDGSDPNLVAQARQAIGKRIEGAERVGKIARAAGLMYFTYEGGQHLKKNSDVFCRNPIVYELYQEYLQALAGQFDLFMHYTHNGTHSSANSWGAKRFIGEPLKEAHKFRALYDYAVRSGQFDPGTGSVRRPAVREKR